LRCLELRPGDLKLGLVPIILLCGDRALPEETDHPFQRSLGKGELGLRLGDGKDSLLPFLRARASLDEVQPGCCGLKRGFTLRDVGLCFGNTRRTQGDFHAGGDPGVVIADARDAQIGVGLCDRGIHIPRIQKDQCLSSPYPLSFLHQHLLYTRHDFGGDGSF
jgi:hypothetical protein